MARNQLIQAINSGAGSSLVKEIIEYHFGIDITTGNIASNEKNQIIAALKTTHEELNGIVTLSDVYSTYSWDEYEAKRVKNYMYKTVNGTSRPGTSPGEEGYVAPKKTPMENKLGSIHIEFSLAADYPRLQMTRIIIHEATHKFAGTKDHAYTYSPSYEDLTPAKRAENADSYAYAAISLCSGTLIKNYNDSFKIIPQYGSPQRETFNISFTNIIGSVFKRLLGL